MQEELTGSGFTLLRLWIARHCRAQGSSVVASGSHESNLGGKWDSTADGSGPLQLSNHHAPHSPAGKTREFRAEIQKEAHEIECGSCRRHRPARRALPREVGKRSFAPPDLTLSSDPTLPHSHPKQRGERERVGEGERGRRRGR
jgi:hypothetical protein